MFQCETLKELNNNRKLAVIKNRPNQSGKFANTFDQLKRRDDSSI